MLKKSIGALLIALCLLGVTANHSFAAALLQDDSGETAFLTGEDAEPIQPPVTAECASVTLIPQSECNALLDFYRNANGAKWDNNNHWRDTADGVTPCDWFGVVCENGHVRQLNLASNGLTGTLSRFLVYLPELQVLDVADNLLEAPLPRSLCLLAERGVAGHFGYNLLLIQNRHSRQCLTQMENGWHLTQTIAPLNARITTIGEHEISLAWDAISYQGDGGYYEIGYTSALTQPYTVHGVTADKSAITYTLDNLTPGQSYYIRLRTFTPAHSQQEKDHYSAPLFFTAVTASEQKVLLMVYAPFDNDLSPYAPGVLARLKAGSKLNPNVITYFLVDQRGDHNTALFVIANNVVSKSNAIMNTWGVDELDTMDPAVLSWFLSEGRKRVSASRTIVSLMGHGAGLEPEFNWLVSSTPGEPPVPQNGIPALPRDHPATPGDETDNSGFLSPIDYGHALNAATNNGANPFDVVFFDHCFAGNLDQLYQVRNTAHVYIVSPNYAWLTASFRAYLPQFEPTATPEQIANRIISIYRQMLNREHPNVIFWINNDEISTLASQVSDLGVALSDALNQGDSSKIEQASLASSFVDTNQCGDANLVLEPPDEMVGISSFASNLQGQFATGTAVHTVADQLLTTLSAIQSRVITGTPYIAPDTTWNYTDTVTILAPLQRNIARNIAWRASIYTVTTPLTALWSPVPTQTVQISESLAFVNDWKWDDFINQWYTAPAAPTVGEWCNYTPPTIITDTVVEALTLAISTTETSALSSAAAQESLTLTWSASEQDDVLGYQLLIRNKNYANWTLLDFLPVEATQYTVDLSTIRGDSEFQLFGYDEADQALSASNVATWKVTVSPPPQQQIFLPLIQRQ